MERDFKLRTYCEAFDVSLQAGFRTDRSGWSCVLRDVGPIHSIDVQRKLLTHRVADQIRFVEGQIDVLAEFADPDVFVAGIFDTLILEDGVTTNPVSI